MVTKVTFSKWSPVHKGRGVYGLYSFLSRYFDDNLAESCYPKKINPDSESAWNSASFNILLKEQKHAQDFLVWTTLGEKSGKIMHNY